MSLQEALGLTGRHNRDYQLRLNGRDTIYNIIDLSGFDRDASLKLISDGVLARTTASRGGAREDLRRRRFRATPTLSRATLSRDADCVTRHKRLRATPTVTHDATTGRRDGHLLPRTGDVRRRPGPRALRELLHRHALLAAVGRRRARGRAVRARPAGRRRRAAVRELPPGRGRRGDGARLADDGLSPSRRPRPPAGRRARRTKNSRRRANPARRTCIKKVTLTSPRRGSPAGARRGRRSCPLGAGRRRARRGRRSWASPRGGARRGP